MPALGPRVGGAHVDVNLQFDDKSVGTVGKRIQKQLSALNKDLVRIGERNSRIYRSLGRDAVTAWRASLGAIVASAPLMGSLVSGVAGAATLLAGAFYSVAQSSYGIAPLLLAIGVAAGAATIGMNGFIDAVKSGEMDGLTPAAAASARAVRSLDGAWQSLRDTVQERLFAGLADDISRLGGTLFPVLERGLGKMADALNGMAQDMLDYVNSAAGLKVINGFLNNMADIFARFSKSVVPFLDGFLRLMNALSPAGKRLADRIADIAKRFQGWTKGAGFAERIDSMMKRAEKTAGLLFSVISNLGAAIANIFNVANPATNTFLEMLVGLTQRFEDWTNSVEGKNSIATWATQSIDVMRQFGKTIEAAFEVIADLADPRVIISFLKTVEGAFDYLAKLPLEKMVSAFADFAEALQPVSSLFLAIIIAGATLNILIGSLMGQFGGLFSVLSKILQFKILTTILKNMGGGASSAGGAAAGAATKTGLLSRAWAFLLKILSKVKSVFSSVIGFFTKTSSAAATTTSRVSSLGKVFKPVMSILGRFVKFAGPVGIAVWIGTIIAKSKDLQAKLGNVWDSLKEVGSALGEAFSEIGAALKPLTPAAKGAGKAFGFIFDILDKIMGFAIGVFLDTIVFGFKSLGKVVKGAGKIIAGFINVLVGLFTWDFGKLWDGLKQLASGIIPLLQGLLGLFITLFAPAKLLGIAGRALGGLAAGFRGAMPGVITAVRGVLSGIFKWIGKLPGQLLDLGKRAIISLGSAIKRGAPAVLQAAGRIVSGVLGWIARLPGRLFDLGVRATGRLGGAIKSGIGKLAQIAREVVESIFSKIKELPGKIGGLAKTMLKAGRSLMKGFLDGLLTAAKGVGGFIGDVATSVVEAIIGAFNSVVDFINDALPDKIEIKFAPDINLPNDPIPKIPGYARGTSNYPGGIGLVGEQGPELVNLPRGSKISTAAETRGLLGDAGGGGNVIIHNMMPHNYSEFERQMREQKRLAALGGRRPVTS